ncbi:hypothetical protein CLIM01_00450 [Colletotrichum limetticola]|uniref:Secreted protein n=1 Tax=Colletotrichum limetticola TaxID=1209924 RepID=A0ABQ9QEJ6_9PEZI|nr:hypothetical protein CLIM01_00450 [Colletotrichum limetticola]
MWKSNAGKFCFCLSTSLLPMNAWLTPHTTRHTDTPISRSLAPSHTRLPHFSHTQTILIAGSQLDWNSRQGYRRAATPALTFTSPHLISPCLTAHRHTDTVPCRSTPGLPIRTLPYLSLSPLDAPRPPPLTPRPHLRSFLLSCRRVKRTRRVALRPVPSLPTAPYRTVLRQPPTPSALRVSFYLTFTF